ncbi:hypothetical protein LCGC14_0595960, partial [marine sediment metagenome]
MVIPFFSVIGSYPNPNASLGLIIGFLFILFFSFFFFESFKPFLVGGLLLLINFFKKIYNKDEDSRRSLKSDYDNYIKAQEYMNSINASFQMIATDINRRFWFSMENN